MKKIDTSRFVEKNVPNKYPGDQIKKVTAIVSSNWMMGGSTGHRRDWNQIFPGTIHWKDGKSSYVNWILVPAGCKTDIVVDKSGMQIFRGESNGNKLVLLVYAPSLKACLFGKTKWELSGLNFTIQTTLTKPTVRPLSNDERKKYTTDVTRDVWMIEYPVNLNMIPKTKPLLTLIPN